jgi:predicted signal transduction protein with EAL and GGDEF domain
MVQQISDMSEEALFQLRLRQAVLAAQHSIKQVGLLLIGFDGVESSVKETADVGDLSEAMRARIRDILRDSDTVIRITNGELAVLLPSVNGPEDAALVAKKILNRLCEPFQPNGLKIAAHPRIGIALFPEHSSDASFLVERADVALSAAHRTRNSFIVYSHQGSQAKRPPLRMNQLRQAIVTDQLFPLYQPKISLKDGSISSLEVLTRWQHPELGIIPPDEFIPVAERTGLIIPLTLWVLHQSLLQCRAWNETGINVGVAVNLSMWNLDAQELPNQIEGLLKNVGVPPDKLELEITESAIMGDPQRAMRSLSMIRELGVRLSIDDFGTGYSSLAYLRKLPVAGLKIDKSFVQNMENERDNAVIVRSIVDLGHNLGLTVIAEGVETSEAQSMLTAFDCDEAQGFYYSRPILATTATSFLKHSVDAAAQRIGSRELLNDLSLEVPLSGNVNGKEASTKF